MPGSGVDGGVGASRGPGGKPALLLVGQVPVQGRPGHSQNLRYGVDALTLGLPCLGHGEEVISDDCGASSGAPLRLAAFSPALVLSLMRERSNSAMAAMIWKKRRPSTMLTRSMRDLLYLMAWLPLILAGASVFSVDAALRARRGQRSGGYR